MPPGVEHPKVSEFIARFLKLITVSMPPGVEHFDEVDAYPPSAG